MSFRICQECNQKYFEYWCKPCTSTHFKNDFDKWTSGNTKLDKFIQDAQLNADMCWKVIEWIPYDSFQDIEQIAKGGYGTVYYADWTDGNIINWDIKNQQWERQSQLVVLKKFNGIVDINEEFLNEVTILLILTTTSSGLTSTTNFFGVTKDPKTHEYIIVLKHYGEGNLRNYLNNNFNDFNWFKKIQYLRFLAVNFLKVHELDIIHCDFHPGNVLIFSTVTNYSNIIDFGSSKLMGSKKNTISGVLPYMAPEVLIGGEYTKATDVYSFAFVAYEIITGFPPYHNVPHDNELAFKICNGFRPKIPFHMPKLITRMIMRCWDARITHRPTFDELFKELLKYSNEYQENKFENNNEITIQIKEAEEFSKNQTTDTITITPTNYETHPQAIYTSRLLDFSNLPKPKNEENFEKKLEELTESFSHIITNDDIENEKNLRIGQNLKISITIKHYVNGKEVEEERKTWHEEDKIAFEMITNFVKDSLKEIRRFNKSKNTSSQELLENQSVNSSSMVRESESEQEEKSKFAYLQKLAPHSNIIDLIGITSLQSIALHKYINSVNILLDKHFQAKITNFRKSRLKPLDRELSLSDTSEDENVPSPQEILNKAEKYHYLKDYIKNLTRLKIIFHKHYLVLFFWEGVNKDIGKAIQYFERAIEKGDGDTMDMMGDMHLKANKKGIPYGMYHLGVCYFKEIGGLKRDEEASKKLILQAASLGNAGI
ncbi:hypothetical protein Glove_104g23 [Diversispora epigaea]|uniref:Protein kinase domain-containing protein n=1 Tax=Diversispora epigaea TaxID=1348612 RepID=A0A397JCL1_9GLOM|nr:hypothetical protein Glove_104g23 [Diversispora epigaea]